MKDRPPSGIKGRGTADKVGGRYLDWRREAVDDGWGEEGPPPRIATTVSVEHPRSIISHNQSPDLPFEASINPYRGCEHGCVYCLSGDTPILMADGQAKPLADLRAGDEIYGTERRGWYRHYVKTRVLAHWSVIKPAYRITLKDATTLVAGGDHRFLTERGWKHVSGTEQGVGRRPHLTRNNKLMGIGGFAVPQARDAEYQRGYLSGMIRGDAHLGSYQYEREGRTCGDQHKFRLALCDLEALHRTQSYLKNCAIETREFIYHHAIGNRRELRAIRTSARNHVLHITRIIAWPSVATAAWFSGFLAGIFDAEGSFSQGALRISNSDRDIIRWTCRGLARFGFEYCIEEIHHTDRKSLQVVRLLGGLKENLRFFHTFTPAISRKRDIKGQAVKSGAELSIVEIEPLPGAYRLYDISTGTGDFIANGVVSHNCYARPTHAYLDLSPGIDFESKLVAKPEAAAILRRELGRPGYRCTPIALGTNTDPYQPIEREWEITRRIIELLGECRHPLTIVTKSWLVERDIDLLAAMAKQDLAYVCLSVMTLSNDLARRLEPRAAAPRRRLEALRRLSEAGIPTGVLFAPVIPFINDAEMEAVLDAAWEAGARQSGYVMLRLPLEIRELFQGWLELHEPLKAARVMNAIRDLRNGRLNDPAFHSRQRGTGALADLIRQRFGVACRRLGFNREDRPLRTDLFTPPRPQTVQMDLF